VIDVLAQATPVFTERSERGWTMVRTLSGRVGWIHDSLLRGER
jgi:SH3-like domain-containing protein